MTATQQLRAILGLVEALSGVVKILDQLPGFSYALAHSLAVRLLAELKIHATTLRAQVRREGAFAYCEMSPSVARAYDDQADGSRA